MARAGSGRISKATGAKGARSSPPELVSAFARAAKSLTRVEARKMFGYPALFVNGNMFAGLVRDMMVLRLSERDRTEFLERRGAKPFIAIFQA